MKLMLQVATLLLFLIATPVFGQGIERSRGITHYSSQLNDQLTQSGRPHLLIFSADWCPTCKYQQKLIKEILKEPEFQNLLVVEADFDSDEDLKKELSVRRQGTIIVRRGDTEVQREVLARDEDTVRTLMRLALADGTTTE